MARCIECNGTNGGHWAYCSKYGGKRAEETMEQYLKRVGATQAQPFNGAKNPNPKDSVGSTKIPMHLWPDTATVYGALGLLDGALKYGRGNYRASPVRASIYYDALKRHVNGWFSGRPCDPDSGLPDLAHALACLAIIVDAEAAGTLIDDRDYNSGYAELIKKMTPNVARLQEMHADKNPKHYTIADSIE